MTEVEKRLYEYRAVQRRIHEYEQQMAELEAKKEAVYDKLLRPKALTQERLPPGPLYDPIVEAVAQIVDVYVQRIKRVAAELRDAEIKLAKIEAWVRDAQLSEIELRYVRLRYFDGLPAWKVAHELGFTESRARDYKCYALIKIEALKVSA